MKENNKMTPKTQKAKGILLSLDQFLAEFPDVLGTFFVKLTHKLIQNEKQISRNYYLPAFARPCPTVPRHGFVDSIPVYSNDELKKLFNKVIKHDLNGEVLLGPYLPNVNCNAVYSDSGILSVGKGNDGATAGKDSISVPVSPLYIPLCVRETSGIKKDEAIFFESVYPVMWARWGLTQMRGGPKIEGVSSDFIPKKIKVEKVVIPNDNLLKWEKEVKELDSGTIVYGKGHTLASHAAIHCVINNVPFITTKKPKVGDILKPINVSSKKINREEFKKGFVAALDLRKNNNFDIFRYFYYSLSVLHNWAYIKNSEHAGWILGSASLLILKICTALIMGEYRHLDESRGSRDDIYSNVMNGKINTFYNLSTIFKDFYDGKWEEGFGGIPWATCSLFSYKLWQNIVSVYNGTSENITKSEISKLISTINKVVNLAHNNGWWFNKIACTSDLDFIADFPGLAAFCVPQIFIAIHEKVKKIKLIELKLERVKSVYNPAGAKDGVIHWAILEGLWRDAEITIYNESSGDLRVKKRRITLSDKEMAALKKKYKKDNRYFEEPIVLQIRAGKFKIPGGPERKIF